MGDASPKNLPADWRRRGGSAFHAACATVAGIVMLAAGCAPAWQRLNGEEARTAAVFFASTADVSFPIRTSFSGVAEISGRTFPFLAGLYSRSPSEETLGFYDPMGRAVLFLRNDGESVSVTLGPAAKEFPPGDIRPLDAGAVSFGRILSGVPGYPAAGGEASVTASGEWVLAGKG